MKVAYHFNADDSASLAEGRYDLTFLRRSFSALRVADGDAQAHVKIWHGDLDAWNRGRTLEQRAAIEAALFRNGQNLWNEVNAPLFLSRIFTTNVYVIMVEGLSEAMRDQIHADLKWEPLYYGALQVYEAIGEHWVLYHATLVPTYRYYRGQLRIFCMVDEEDDQDKSLEEYWVDSGLFRSVVWEILGARYTVFESRDNFEDARRLSELDRMLPADLSVMVDDLLMRLRDEKPQLCDELYAACERLRTIKTSADAAQAAVSCRRFLEGLADRLYPARAERVNDRKVDQASYMNRLAAYIEVNLGGEKAAVAEQLNEMGTALRDPYDGAQDGVHSHSNRDKVDWMIRSLVTIAYRILQLAPPPLTLPEEPYEEDLRKSLLEKRDD